MKNVSKKFLQQALTILAGTSLLFFAIFTSCSVTVNEKDEFPDGRKPVTNKEGFGTVVVKGDFDTSNKYPELKEISHVVATISGPDVAVEDINAKISGGEGAATFTKVPAGYNRIVTFRPLKTIENVLNDVDGLVLRAVTDVKNKDITTIRVNWGTTAEANIYNELFSPNSESVSAGFSYGVDITTLSRQVVASYIDKSVSPLLLDYQRIAQDISYSPGVECTDPSQYVLRTGSLSLFTSSVDVNSKIRVHVNDGVSKAVNLDSGILIENIAPGTHRLYIIQKESGTVIYQQDVKIREGENTKLDGIIELKAVKPRLENESGKSVSPKMQDKLAATFFLNSRTLDGEKPLKGAKIYYTISTQKIENGEGYDIKDPIIPTDTSELYNKEKGLKVEIDTKISARVYVDGLEPSDVVTWEFRKAAIGDMHPADGAFSIVEEDYSNLSAADITPGAVDDAAGNTLFTLYSKNATKVLLEIYSNPYGEDARYDYWMVKCKDDYWRLKLSTVPTGTVYAYRCWGPNWTFSENWKRGNSGAGFVVDCDEDGNRFDPNKTLFDPYAKELTHDRGSPEASAASGLHGGIYGTGGEEVTLQGVTDKRRNFDTGRLSPKGYIVRDTSDYGVKPHLPAQDAIIYEAHARGFTKHESTMKLTKILKDMKKLADKTGNKLMDDFETVPDVPKEKLGTYAGAALLVPYLKAIGITTIELLPVHESNNDVNTDTYEQYLNNGNTFGNNGDGNYWSYMTYGFFAPDRRHSSDKTPGGPTREFKSMVKAFHDAGLEVYLDVVYNHTGEGGFWNKTTPEVCELTFMRGIDNSTYYCLVNSDKAQYWESSGCGNNMHCDNPIVRNLIIDSLTYWLRDMGVDGFRFDIATILGRVESSSDHNWNFSQNSQTLKQIAALGKAYDAEMIAEPWDASGGGYQINNFPKGWAEWNGKFRDVIRNYVNTGSRTRGNDGDILRFINGDYDGYNWKGGPNCSINFVVAHDGYTLSDLCTYQGQGNGLNLQLTWPFGPSDGGNTDGNYVADDSHEGIRRGVRNFFALQMTSRGIPMIVWGDEIGRSQKGNNNAYNVDSVCGYNNYYMINTTSPHMVKTGQGGAYDNNFGTFNNIEDINGNFVFAQYMMRLRDSEPAFRQSNYDSVNYGYCSPDGSPIDGQNPSFRVYIRGSDIGSSDYMVLSNMAGNAVTYTIPPAQDGFTWRLLADTGTYYEKDLNCWDETHAQEITGSYLVAPRSVAIVKACGKGGAGGNRVAIPKIAGTSYFTSTSTKISITCEDTSARIYYTTDGSDPSTKSSLYKKPFDIKKTTTIKAFATDPNGEKEPSLIASVLFTKGEATGGVDNTPKGAVMLQGFTWESASETNKTGSYDWYATVEDNASKIKNNFSFIWCPPPSQSLDTQGYLPRELNDLNSNYGTEAQLKSMITSLSPCEALADIVVNHRVGNTSWGDFVNPSFEVAKGVNYKAICSDDEGFTNEPNLMGSVGASMRGAADTGAKYEHARDLDHTNEVVQNGIIKWLDEKILAAGFVGYRYDYAKGYDGSYAGLYSSSNYSGSGNSKKNKVKFSVGEYWPEEGSDKKAKIDEWIIETQSGGFRNRAFDFVLKDKLNAVFGTQTSSTPSNISNKNYSLLADPTCLYNYSSRDAVTFIDNHDTGSTQRMAMLDERDLGAAYALILTHPGIPCVSWEHYFTASESNITNTSSENYKQYKGDSLVPGTPAVDLTYSGRNKARVVVASTDNKRLIKARKAASLLQVLGEEDTAEARSVRADTTTGLTTLHDHIAYLMKLRKDVGITYDAKVTVLSKTYQHYAAKVTGTDGELVVVLGTDYYAPTEEGYAGNKAIYGGDGFAIWQRGTPGNFGVEAPPPVTYTITNLPEWWGDKDDIGQNVNHYIYYWDSSDDNNNGWATGTLTGSTITFAVGGTLDRCIPCRFPSITKLEEASFDIEEDEKKMYNKSEQDLILNTSTKSFSYNNQSTGGGGGESGGGGSGGSKATYTITGLPSWWGDADAAQFVYLFKKVDGQDSTPSSPWVKATYDGSKSTLTFDYTGDANYCIAVRCKAGTTSGSWDSMYNQSADLPLKESMEYKGK